MTMGRSLWCRECGRSTNHGMWHGNWYEYKGHTVVKCNLCGRLRTSEHVEVDEDEIVHSPTGEKYARVQSSEKSGEQDD